MKYLNYCRFPKQRKLMYVKTMYQIANFVWVPGTNDISTSTKYNFNFKSFTTTGCLLSVDARFFLRLDLNTGWYKFNM